jgi:opacity protein-like surface antigen
MKYLKCSLALSMALAMSSPVLAQGSSWFAGASNGASAAAKKLTTPAGTDEYEVATVGKLFGGYWISPYVGIEVGYTALGDLDAEVSNIKHTLDVRGYTAAALGRFPVSEKISLLVKGGAMRWSATSKESSNESRNNGTTTLAGIGAEFGVARNISLRTEYEVVNDVGAEEGDETQIRLVTLSVLLRF